MCRPVSDDRRAAAGATGVNGLRVGLLAAVLVLCWTALPGVQAQSPATREENVYLVNARLGDTFESAFYPRHLDTIYIQADLPAVLTLRRTQVYYWPITNEVKADLDALNEQVEGTLEVRRRNRLIAQIPLQDYVVQYAEGRGNSPGELYLGEQAFEQWTRFETARTAYRRTVSQFYRDTLEYRQDLDAKIAAGELEGPPPDPPAEPSPFLYSSTEVRQGHALNLPAGRYRLSLVDEQGQQVKGTSMRLAVFQSTGSGTAYDVIPHDRYTFPEKSPDARQAIYLRSDSAAYLQPFAQIEFKEKELLRFQNPQDWNARSDRHSWMRMEEIEDAVLAVYSGRRLVQRVERRPYAVRQITGAALGYEIHDQTQTDLERMRERRPDFHGFELRAQDLPPRAAIQLEDSEGRPFPGSRRRVLVMGDAELSWALALPSLPFAAVFAVALARRRRFRRLPRELE